MKIGVVINFENDIKKTNEVYQTLQEIAFDKKIELTFQIVGLNNVDMQFSEASLKEISEIIVVTENDYNLPKFKDKSITRFSYKEVMENTENIFNKFINSGENDITNEKNKIKKSPFNTYLKHLKIGVNAIVPFIITGGFITIINFIFNIYCKNSNYFLSLMANLSTIIFAFIVPVLSAFIAMSIANKEGFLSGLIAGALSSVIGAGFIGGIIFGLLAGYITKYFNDKFKLPDNMLGLKTFIIIPILSTLIISLLILFIAYPFCKLFSQFGSNLLLFLHDKNIIVLCIVISLFISFDLGGIFGKTAIAVSLTLMSGGINIPQAAAIGAAMVPPLGLALATLINKNKYSREEIETAKVAWIFGLGGLTEGALPFAISDPLKIVPSIMLGSSVTGLLCALFKCTVHVANGGLFALSVANSFSEIVLFLFSVSIGAIITAFLVNFLKR